VNESEDKGEPTGDIGLRRFPCSEDVHRRPTALIDLPSRIDVVLVQKLHVDGRQREIAAEPAIDAWTEIDSTRDLSGLEMTADIDLFGIDRNATLKTHPLRVSWRCGGEERGEKYKKLDDAASKMSSVCDQGGLLSWLRRRRFKIQATRCYRRLDSRSCSGGTLGSAGRKASQWLLG